MGEVGNIWIKIGAKWDEIEKATSVVDKAMVKLGDRFQKVGKELSIAGAAITGAMTLMLVKAAKYGDEMVEISQKVGINVTTLSSYKLAADKMGMSIDGLARGLKFLSVNMVEASRGTGDGAAIFKELGISVTDASGNLRDTDTVLGEVATAFAGMEGGAEKTTLAVKLFGRSGMDMIPFLNLGADGLARERLEAERLGLTLTGPVAEAQNKFKDQLDTLKDATLGASMAIGSALIPTVQSIVKVMIDALAGVVALTKAHPGLTKVIAGTVFVIGTLLTALGSTAFAIGTVLKHLPALTTGLKVIKAIALNPIAIIITVAIPVLSKAVRDFKKEFDNMRAAMEESGKSKFVSFLEAVNSGWRRVALGIKDSSLVLSEANKKMREAQDTTINLKGALILLGDAWKAIKGAVDAATSSTINVAAIFKEFGLKTRTDLTAELKNAEAALKLLKTSAEATPGAIKALEDKIASLKESLYGAKTETKSFDETLRKLKPTVADLEEAFNKLMDGMDDLPATSEEVADAMSKEFADLREQMQKDFEELAMKDFPDWMFNLWKESEKTANEMDQIWESTTDDMAKAFGEAFANIIRDGLNFANFFKSLMQGIVNAVATLIGKQLTDIFINFFKKLGAQAGGAFSGFSASANAAAFGIAAGFAAMWVGIGIGMIESKRQWDEYWDEIEEKARRAGKTILETIKLAQLLADTIGDIADEWKRIGPGPGPGPVIPVPEEKISEWEKALNAVRSCIDGIYASSEEMNDAWSNLLDTAKKLGKEGSKELIELIKAFRAAGKECQALNEYMQSWLKTIPNAILVLVHSMDVLISASKKVKESLIDLFKGSTDAQKKNTKEFKRSLDEIGRLAILTFNSMIASGMSFYEAIMAISDSVYALRAEYKKLGMEAPIEFRKLFRIVGLTKQHKELFEAIDATRQIMIALGNSAWLTADAWTTLTGQAVKQFHLLRHHGFSVQDSLRAMAPTLQAIVNYADAYGFELDKQTQSLVNQARRMGLIKEVQKDQVTLMNEWNVGVQKAYNVFLAIAKVLGADVSGAMGGINDKMGLLSLKGEAFAATGSEAEQTWKTAMAEMAVGARKAYQVLLLIAKVLGADISEFMNEMKDGALAFVDAGIQAGKAWVGAAIAAKKAWGSVIFPTADIPNFRHFGSGGIAYTPQLAVVGEVPEIIMPLRDYQTGNLPGMGAGAAANQSITLQNHLYIDGREMKVFITKTIRDWSKAELMQIHPRAVRAY